MFVPREKSYDKPRQHIKKQRYHFADQAVSQSYVFFSSYVWMWELNHKEGQKIDALELGTGKDSWESLEQQGGQTSQSLRKSTLNIQ